MKVSLFGRGVDYEFWTINADQFKSIVDLGIDNFLDSMGDESLGMSDCRSGLVPDTAISSLLIDEIPVVGIPPIGEDSLIQPSADSVIQHVKYQCMDEEVLAQPGYYLLVRCDVSKGTWAYIEIDGEFDPELLSITAEPIRLSNKDETAEVLIEASSCLYNDENFDFEETTGQARNWYLIDKDGKVLDI